MRLDGKTALIAGAGSGLGRAAANRFAEEGATVVTADVDLAGAEETIEQVEADWITGQALVVDGGFSRR